MKKLLLLALPVLAAALVIPAAFAGNSAPKVTGDVTFMNLGQPQHWVFSAQDLGNGQAKGTVTDEWGGGTSFAKIVKAQVLDAHTATFTTEVTSTVGPTPYIQVGDRFSYTVHDEGEGSNGSGDWFTYDGMERGGVHYDGTGLVYTLTSGNIQIH